jgi:hypothetical protein
MKGEAEAIGISALQLWELGSMSAWAPEEAAEVGAEAAEPVEAVVEGD